MRAECIWPNGLRYLWIDALGVVLYVSRYRELGEERWLDEAERLVAEVERVLGRPRGCASARRPIMHLRVKLGHIRSCRVCLPHKAGREIEFFRPPVRRPPVQKGERLWP
jgi:hypothetical protein